MAYIASYNNSGYANSYDKQPGRTYTTREYHEPYTPRDHDAPPPPHSAVIIPSSHHSGPPRWNWAGVITAVVVTLFCWGGILCSLPGLVYTLLSYTDHKSRDYSRSKFKHRCAWGWLLAAIIVGLILWIIVILILVGVIRPIGYGIYGK